MVYSAWKHNGISKKTSKFLIMGAIKLNQIDSYKPCLTDRDIENTCKSIIDKIDIYNEDGYRLFEFECANGITIHIEVNYCGFNYRMIRLQNVYVMYKDDDQFISIEEYENTIRSLIADSIYDINNKEEEEYELQEQYSWKIKPMNQA